MTMQKELYGLLGESLKHSYSQIIHEQIAGYSYELFSVQPSHLEPFLTNEELAGLNVTIPYKQTVMQYCKTLSPEAQAIGSVNTMHRLPNGAWAGHNTDYAGFLYLLHKAGILLKHKKVLLLGTGGTARMVQYAATQLQAKEVISISRTGENNYQNLAKHQNAQILINTTPVGMYPNNMETLVSLQHFPYCEGVVDVIYNPLRTTLVQKAQQRGIPAIGGLPMLVKQATAANEIFTGKALEEGAHEKVLQKLGKEITNIVLIGMPGAGKTTIGKQVAKSLNRQFVDIDELILAQEGQTAGDIIQQKGEQAFREIEQRTIESVAKQTGKVIATGGGAVLAEKNRTALRANGQIYYLNRALKLLETQGRPLSVNLNEMYAERNPLYQSVANKQIQNNEKIEAAVTAILEDFHENFSAEWA